MTDSPVHHDPALNTSIPQLRQKELRNRMHIIQPLRNSAPSRLQNFDDLYFANFMASPEFTDAVKWKTGSLSNLFSLDCSVKRNGLGFCPNIASDYACNLPGGRLLSSNSVTGSDASSASSPLGERHFFESSLSGPFSGEHTNGSDDLTPRDSHSATFDLTAQQSTETAVCRNGEHEKVDELDVRLRYDLKEHRHLGELVRKDTFALAAFKLKQTEQDQKVDDLTDSDSVDNAVASDHPKEQKEIEACLDEDTSSLSSDDTYVADNDDQTNKPTVYRSFSDSTVHHTHKKELKRRKSVHFADTSGYDLEVHFPISNVDDFTVPPRLMQALEKLRSRVDAQDEKFEVGFEKHGFDPQPYHHSLVLAFQQPFLEATFQGRVSRQNVCLESISLLPNSLSFTGVVRVVNLDFEKKVTVRYTTDNWRTYIDIPALWVSSLVEFQQDQFSFHIVVSDEVTISGKLELAVRYLLSRTGHEFWDNNYGRNYIISCTEHRGNSCDDKMMT